MPLAGATVRLVCGTTPGEQDPVWLLAPAATGPPPETIKKPATPSLFQDSFQERPNTKFPHPTFYRRKAWGPGYTKMTQSRSCKLCPSLQRKVMVEGVWEEGEDDWELASVQHLLTPCQFTDSASAAPLCSWYSHGPHFTDGETEVYHSLSKHKCVWTSPQQMVPCALSQLIWPQLPVGTEKSVLGPT